MEYMQNLIKGIHNSKLIIFIVILLILEMFKEI